MNAISIINAALKMSEEWTLGFAEDLKTAPLVSPTPNGGNHPLWVIGHLALSEAGLQAMISGAANPCEAWRPLFDGGSQPTTDATAYPPFDEVLAAYKRHMNKTNQMLEQIGDAGLDQTPPHVPDTMASTGYFRTVGGVFQFIAMHRMMHIGQLADARRADGRKPLVA